ncbi:MAG: fibronectin type III domain-containing protein, partial [Patescibacteria group bacterium]
MKIVRALFFLLVITYSASVWALDAPVITAAAKGPNQINLTWSDIANPGWGYRVEIQSNGDSRYTNWTELPITVNGRNYLPYWVTEGQYLDPTDAASGNGTPAQFPVFGLRNNTTYNFRVRSYAKTDSGIDTYSSYSATASAATRNYNPYYVSTTGTDSGTCGTQSSPCRHIYYAVNSGNRNLAQPGNVIIVMGGNYANDYVIPPNSGSYGVDNKVVIMANPGETVMITSHGAASWDPNIHLNGRQYVVIDGINTTAEVNGANTATVAITSNSFRNAIVNVEIGYTGWPFIVYGSYNLIHRVYSHDAGSASGDGSDHMAIIFYDTLADRNVIQYSNFRRGEHDTGLFKNGADYNKFLNNLCDGGWGHGFATVSDGGAVSSYNLFEGNVVKDVATNYTTDVYKV